jgi:hypothetical protein
MERGAARFCASRELVIGRLPFEAEAIYDEITHCAALASLFHA